MVKKLRRVWCAVMAVLMLVAVAMAPVSGALAARQDQLSEEDMYFYGQNGIYFWYPWGTAETCYGTLAGSTLVEKVLSYLLALGFTPTAAAGIYGNWIHEGLGAGVLLSHENGTDDASDIGTYYSAANLYITENEVRGLDDAGVMHGLGFAQWSYGRRVRLLERLDAAGLGEYARAWDDARGVYVYDNTTYDMMVSEVGENTADGILSVELEFARAELAGETESKFLVYNDDIEAQGLAKYGITSGMSAFEALNLVETPAEAAELFMTTYEMPGWSRMNQDGTDRSARARSAEEGMALMESQGITAGGSTTCNGNSSIVDTALELAWEGHVEDSANNLKPEYAAAMQAVGTYVTPCSGEGNCAPMGASCDIFVSTVLRYSGADSNFPAYNPQAQREYMVEHSDMYEEIENLEDTSNLQPGDIFVVATAVNQRHIFIYMGVEDGQWMQASASYGSRTGEYFAYENYRDYGELYRIFRRKN